MKKLYLIIIAMLMALLISCSNTQISSQNTSSGVAGESDGNAGNSSESEEDFSDDESQGDDSGNTDFTVPQGINISEETTNILSKTTLPVIYINTDDHIGDEYITAKVVCSGLSEDYSNTAQIKLRGNSTRYRDKRPYRLKLDEKADLIGSGSNKNWVLLANDIDHSLIRNKITLDFARAIGMETTSESELVSVVLNGVYDGVYQLCEQIRVSDESVNIYDWKDSFETGNVDENVPQTGGFILEADFYTFNKPDSEITKVITAFKQPFYFNSPDGVTKDDALYEYAYNYIQSFEYALHSGDYIYHAYETHYEGIGDHFSWNDWVWRSSTKEYDYNYDAYDGMHYSELFDIEQLVNNFFVCEISNNWDSMKNSLFLYKDIDSLACIGPEWDFDWAYGNRNMYNIYTDVRDEWHTTNDYFTNEQYYQSVQWNRYLIRDPYFVLLVYDKYNEIRDDQMQALLDSVSDYGSLLKSDGEANDARWGYTYTPEYYAGEYPDDFTGSIEALKSFITDRYSWMDEQFASYETLLKSLGAYIPSNKIRIFANEDSSGNTGITVKISDQRAGKAEIQINGVNTEIITLDENGSATYTLGNDMLIRNTNMIQVHALTDEGERIRENDDPDSLCMSNYIIL